jgi:hypothetical protein
VVSSAASAIASGARGAAIIESIQQRLWATSA